MTRKFALAALAATALVAGPLFVTSAEAQGFGQRCDPRARGCNVVNPNSGGQNIRRPNNNLAIGIAAGVGGLLIGSAIANAQPRHYGESRYHAEPRYQARPRYHGHGFQTVGAYEADEEECFRKPIRRFDHYSGRVVTVGTKLVCR